MDLDICQMTSPAPVYAEVTLRTGKQSQTVRKRLWPAGWTTILVPVSGAGDGLGLVRVTVECPDIPGAPLGPWSIGALRLA